MPFTSQKFIDTRNGEIVTSVPVSQIAHFEEYNGPLLCGDFCCTACHRGELDCSLDPCEAVKQDRGAQTISSLIPTIEERVSFARVATDAYMSVCPTDDCDALCDLLTDLMHYAKSDGEIFDKELSRAREHFTSEQKEVQA